MTTPTPNPTPAPSIRVVNVRGLNRPASQRERSTDAMGYHEQPAGQPDRPVEPAEPPGSVDPAAVFPLIRPLTGLTLSVCSALAGSRRAYQQGDVIYVSPAMWDLLSHADGREMEVLLRVIEVVKLPAFSVYSSVYTLRAATKPHAPSPADSFTSVACDRSRPPHSPETPP